MNLSTKIIIIAEDFSEFPAGRFREDGKWSGEAFRDDILVVALQDAEKVEVVFDGVVGFGSAFLEEAFGGLVRECHMDKSSLDEHLRLRTDDPDLVDSVQLAKRCIEEADSRLRRQQGGRTPCTD